MNVKELISALRKHRGSVYTDMMMKHDSVPVKLNKSDLISCLAEMDRDSPAPWYFNTEGKNLFLHTVH